jgi:hypothetical protein
VADLFSMMDPPTAGVPTAQQLADDGMSRAVAHADAVEEGWSDRAYRLLCRYATEHSEFMTEEVRVWAHAIGLPKPPDGRAWGAVTLRAVKASIICCRRYQKTRIPPAHATPRPVWGSLCFRELAA